METCYSGPKEDVLDPKTTDEDWDPQTQEILVLITLFCVHKMTGEVWNT